MRFLIQNRNDIFYNNSFDESINLLCTELSSCSPDEIYKLCFSRLLKTDTFELFNKMPYLDTSNFQKTQMLGTNERDLFAPPLKEVAASEPNSILDIGGGDGQTTQILLDLLQKKPEILLVEPNQSYSKSYEKVFQIKYGDNAVVKRYDDIKSYIKLVGNNILYDCCLVIHSIYFFDEIKPELKKLYESLNPGGSLFIVFADELNGYTGTVVQDFYSKTSKEKFDKFYNKVKERHTIFGIEYDSINEKVALRNLQRLFDSEVIIKYCSYDTSRLYGHSFSDLLALGFITDLAFQDTHSAVDRVEHVANTLKTKYERLGLAIDIDGSRKRMLSVVEQQVTIHLKKPPSNRFHRNDGNP
ncbi:MAG: class I SAM-dependent methyltransferase [Pseudomonadota bacterium]